MGNQPAFVNTLEVKRYEKQDIYNHILHYVVKVVLIISAIEVKEIDILKMLQHQFLNM